MSASPKPEPTAMSKRVDEGVHALRERNAMVAQIRGTQWGLGIDSRTTKAVAHYCLTMGLDPVRHVEVLGGRIYLTAEFYQERGARLIRSGAVVLEQAEFINVDPRLDSMAASDDAEDVAWAKAEITRRTRARIQHNAPDEAVAIAVQPITVKATGMRVVGVSWCGGGTRKKMGKGGTIVNGDPIGDMEPTKTALTRAARRAWKLVAEVIEDYGAQVRPIEVQATLINEELDTDREVAPSTLSPQRGPTPLLGESRDLVSVIVDAQPERMEIRGEMEPPYGDQSSASARVDAPEAAASAFEVARDVVTLPNWKNHQLALKTLDQVETSELASLYSTLMKDAPELYADLIGHIGLELDHRTNSR